MKLSLSMILPVRNAQAEVASLIAQAVEVLPDLTPQWELLVVDDGSTDATPEVAGDLARHFPQVNVIHHTLPLGAAACQRSGLHAARHEVFLLREHDCTLRLSGIHKMWLRQPSHDIVIARSPQVDSLPARRPAVSARQSSRNAGAIGLQMIRRRAIEGWLATDTDEELQVYLARKRYPQHEVELRSVAAVDKALLAPSGAPRPTLSKTAVLPRHRDDAVSGGDLKRPNYLTRLRRFAWGE